MLNRAYFINWSVKPARTKVGEIQVKSLETPSVCLAQILGLGPGASCRNKLK